MTEEEESNKRLQTTIARTLHDPVLQKLLERSNLTKVQFETVFVDQLGSELANKDLTREEMSATRVPGEKISRGAFNRSLSQARRNVAESIHTVLLLGYAGLLDSPSLAPFVEASERLRSHTERIRERVDGDERTYSNLVESLLEELERAMKSLYGKERDT